MNPEEMTVSATPMTLAELTERVAKINREKGWHDDDRTVGDDVALLHSEASEMLEEFRNGHLAHEIYFTSSGSGQQLSEFHVAEILQDASTQLGYDLTGEFKPEGFGIEAADLAIRLVDVCYRRHVDLERCIEAKLRYNATRPYRHGGKVI